MAHFRGTIIGGRGEASRLGHASTGLKVEACSWQGKVVTRLYVDAHGVDCAEVRLERHNGAGVDVTLFNGPVSGAHIEHFIAACRA